MEQASIALSLAVAALSVACEGSDVRMRPEVPSDLTTTTGAPASSTRAARANGTAPAPLLLRRQRTQLRAALGPRRHLHGSVARTTGLGGRGATPRHASAPFTDPEIAAILEAAGRGERLLAREALKRATSAHVRQLAQRVLSDHGSAKLEKVEKEVALAPVDNPTSAELGSKAARAVQGLAASNPRDFDRLYVDALASEERRLVDLLDGQLIPQAQSGELRTFLQSLRTATSSRLGTAEELRARDH